MVNTTKDVHRATSGRRKSPHVALSHPSHPQPLGTTHIRLSHPMLFKSSQFLQNTMGTELEGRCCQPQELTAHCTHMLKTHWRGFMLNAFPGQNPIGTLPLKGSYPSNINSVFSWFPRNTQQKGCRRECRATLRECASACGTTSSAAAREERTTQWQ